MGFVSGIVVYLCLWWTVIFCTLPLWVKRDESGPETVASGAPLNPYIKEKVILTTIISAVLWIVIYILINQEIINFRDIAEKMHENGL